MSGLRDQSNAIHFVPHRALRWLSGSAAPNSWRTVMVGGAHDLEEDMAR
jgi:hypothetical protein